MNRSGRAWRSTCAAWLAPALILLLAVSPAVAQPRRHALLVGIGDYRYVGDLQGPPHDVRSLEQALRRDWGFDRITTLVDGDATRAAILGALDDAIRDTAPGDHVFVYFSGHGTSFRNRRGSGIEARLHPGTGGLFPAEFHPRSPDAYRRLIVGSRDLRPRLLRLDRGRNVFVVFDTCYSGDTVRSVSCGLPRFQPWQSHVDGAADFGAQTAEAVPYPYRNLLYLSASASHQAACDIRMQDLWRTPTVDGRPHGALTDALLRGLAGEANTDGNGELTVRELHAYVRRSVEEKFRQTPQLLYPRNRVDAPDRPVFGLPLVAPPGSVPGPAPVATTMRVWLGVGAGILHERLSRLDGVSVSTGAYDLRVDADPGRPTFTLRHGSGAPLASALGVGETVRRVARHGAVHTLLNESFAGQDFNVRVNMLQRSDRGVLAPPARAELVVGGHYELRYESDAAAYFLLVTVDVQGVMRVLAPWTRDDLRPARGGRIPDLVVQAPAGTEFVKLFAFRRRPPGFNDWLPAGGGDGHMRPRVIDSAGQVEALLRFVRASSDAAAQTSRRFVSRQP